MTTQLLTPEQQQARLARILAGTEAPNPIVSISFRNSAGELDPTPIPARLQEGLSHLFINFMSKGLLEQAEQIALLKQENRDIDARLAGLED